MARRPPSITLRLGPQGRIVIPAEIRREMKIVPGETLTARLESDRLVIERRDQVLERMRSELRGHKSKDRNMVDELIAERRAEAKRENERRGP